MLHVKPTQDASNTLALSYVITVDDLPRCDTEVISKGLDKHCGAILKQGSTDEHIVSNEKQDC